MAVSAVQRLNGLNGNGLDNLVLITTLAVLSDRLADFDPRCAPGSPNRRVLPSR